MALSSVIQYKGDREGSFRAGEITAREEAEVTLLVCIVGHSSLEQNVFVGEHLYIVHSCAT